jgi:hypothetical protein
MTFSTPFNAAIEVPDRMCGQTVKDRIAHTRHTHGLGERLKCRAAEDKKLQYQQNLIDNLMAACSRTKAFCDPEIATQSVEKFLALARTLENAKALAVSFGAAENVENQQVSEVTVALGGYPTPGDTPGRSKLSTSKHIRENMLHPLFIALLAFQYGGPINAAFGTHEHDWRPSETTPKGMSSFCSEGDTGSIFDGLRMTVVWETRDGKTKEPSGAHSVFLTGESGPRRLALLDNQDQAHGDTPLTIVYDSQHAALYYDSEDPGAVRKSITVDFHLNSITDDDLELLSTPSQQQSCSNLSLSELVTQFPISNYDAHFHDLLFDAASLDTILTKLSSITVPL